MKLTKYSQSLIQYTLKTKTHQGKKYLIVPVVMMVEGVHNGSRGPLLHPANELGKFPDSWNGIPIVINHPQDVQGNYVSANSPDLIDSDSVGRVYNTVMEDKKLKAEAWIDETKINQISPTALAYIQQGRPLEVSIGAFTDEESVEGEYGEEHYVGIARNHRPDHLALLPNDTGACSWSDGCGIRANSENKKKGGANVENLEEMKKESYDRIFNLNVNIQGFRELLDRMYSLVNAMDSETYYHFLEEVYENYFIYRRRQRNAEGNGEEKWFQQSFTSTDNKIELVGDPIEVVKKVTYSPTVATNENKLTRTKGGERKMSDKKTACFLGKVERLINNNRTNFTEEDKEWLLAQEEATLDKLMPKEEVQTNSEQIIQTFKNTLKTVEDVLKIVPEEVRITIEEGIKVHQEKKKELVQGILANSEKETWTEVELNAMDTKMLEKISKSLRIVDYSANGGQPPIVNGGIEPLAPCGVTFEIKK